jgi:hypothetical protein
MCGLGSHVDINWYFCECCGNDGRNLISTSSGTNYPLEFTWFPQLSNVAAAIIEDVATLLGSCVASAELQESTTRIYIVKHIYTSGMFLQEIH